jgi:hypothetical protein
LLVLNILKTEKSRVHDRFISYSKYSRRGTLFIQKKVGSALTETENWDLLVDCTNRDGRQMLDAGVHLSDKRTYRFKHSTKYSTKSASAFTNGEKTTDSIISNNAFKFILPCLRPLECNEKNQICFLMKGEN